jgi:hypothetical protein
MKTDKWYRNASNSIAIRVNSGPALSPPSASRPISVVTCLIGRGGRIDTAHPNFDWFATEEEALRWLADEMRHWRRLERI